MVINYKFVRINVLAACVLWTGLNVQAAVLIADAFTTGATPRAVGEPLLGTTTPVGGATWVGNSSPLFMADNAVGNGTDPVPAAIVGFVSLASAPAGNKIVTVQADADFRGNSWGSVQFSNVAGTTSDVFASDLLLYFSQVGTSGSYVIFANDFNTVVTSGNVTAIVGANALQLSYDTASNTASAWINGNNVVNAVSLGAYTPVLNYAGFGAYDTVNHDATLTRVDNFQVDVTVVPEPGAISLLVLGGVLACSRFRKTSPRCR
jgi:hypothetical protein